MAVRDDFTAGEVLAAADLNDTFGAKLNLAGGKVLQVVRATDGTNRTTTSTSFVDASISVTITPEKSDSAILLIWSLYCSKAVGAYGVFQITDNSNNAMSGAQGTFVGQASGSLDLHQTFIAYDTPATVSATTYKGRFRSSDGNDSNINNSLATAQLYAIEVSA